MKNNANILKCYVNGKKSAIICESGSMFLGSHTLAWNNTKLGNMYGWKFMYRLGDFSGVLTETAAATMLAESGPEKLTNVCFEGSPEYAKIRENITRRARKDTPAEPAPAPMPEPVPAPVPVPAEPRKDNEVKHDKFARLLQLMQLGESVYLYGPAGSGKNYVCEQIARALGLEFYYQNSITDEYKLTGFIDASGNYHESEFYRAFTRGGLFMLDELDASCPDTLVTLNAALANGYFTFPGGREKMHPDFHCIAAGNTCGRGADEMYTGRSVIDASSLDRFTPMKFDYCAGIEKNLAGGRSDILEFIYDMRNSAAAAGVHIVLGYRKISRLAKFMKAGIDTAEAVSLAITGGYDRDEINILRAGLTHKNNVFALAM